MANPPTGFLVLVCHEALTHDLLRHTGTWRLHLLLHDVVAEGKQAGDTMVGTLTQFADGNMYVFAESSSRSSMKTA